jgi:hypothetical protein
MKALVSCLAVVALLALASPSRAQDTPRVGDVVYAQWEPNDWYHGKVGGKNAKGFRIDFDDGGKKVVASSEIAIDKPPARREVKEGSRVVAKWPDDGRFYPGEVGRIRDDGKFHIKFDDGGLANVVLQDIRFISP